MELTNEPGSVLQPLPERLLYFFRHGNRRVENLRLGPACLILELLPEVQRQRRHSPLASHRRIDLLRQRLPQLQALTPVGIEEPVSAPLLAFALGHRSQVEAVIDPLV